MKKKICMLAMALAMLFALPARAEYWAGDTQHTVYCQEGHPGCEVLQMVMMGSFSEFDGADRLSVRVMSAALAQLSAVSESDMAHFHSYFEVEESVLRENYYRALGNCLLADILLDAGQEGQEEQVRRILRLFLDPGSQWDAQLQMDVIRKQADDALIELMARTVGLPQEFIAHVIGYPARGTQEPENTAGDIAGDEAATPE